MADHTNGGDGDDGNDGEGEIQAKRQPKPPVGAQLIVIPGEFLFSHCEARCPVCLAPVEGAGLVCLAPVRGGLALNLYCIWCE